MLFPHVCFRRGRMPDLNHIPPAWQADALTTQSQQPNLVYHVEKLRSFISPPYLIWSCYIIFIREKLSESCTFPVNNPIKSQIFLVKGAIIHQGRGGTNLHFISGVSSTDALIYINIYIYICVCTAKWIKKAQMPRLTSMDFFLNGTEIH